MSETSFTTLQPFSVPLLSNSVSAHHANANYVHSLVRSNLDLISHVAAGQQSIENTRHAEINLTNDENVPNNTEYI